MSNTTFKDEDVKIWFGNGINDGYRIVRALRCGPFAIHNPYGSGRRGYTISHIPTGRRIFDSPTLAKAKAAVRIMLNSSTDWEVLTRAKANTKAMKKQRNEWMVPIVEKGLMIHYSETPEEFLSRFCGVPLTSA